MKKIFLLIFLSYCVFFFLFPPLQNSDEEGHFEVAYWMSRFAYPIVPMFTVDIYLSKQMNSLFEYIVQHPENIPNFKKVHLSYLQTHTDYSTKDKKQIIPLDGQAYNPPLYYAVGALFLLLSHFFHATLLTQFYFTRLASGLFYFATVYIAYKMLTILFKNQLIVRGVLIFFALNPLFIQSGIGISPDIAVTFFSTLFLYYLIVFQKTLFKPMNLFVLGSIAGLASLSKITGIILVPTFLLFSFFQKTSLNKWIVSCCFFLIPFCLLQLPWITLNLLRYHTPSVAINALGYPVQKGLAMPITNAFLATIFGYRHTFMHFSGVLGWNDSFLFSPIYILYTVCFVLFAAIGVVFSLKEKKQFELFLILFIGIFFLFFFCLDFPRKLYFHPGWETGGRNILPIYLPLVIFIAKGIAISFKRKLEQISIYLSYFSIWYYYLILIFVLLPRYYV